MSLVRPVYPRKLPTYRVAQARQPWATTGLSPLRRELQKLFVALAAAVVAHGTSSIRTSGEGQRADEANRCLNHTVVWLCVFFLPLVPHWPDPSSDLRTAIRRLWPWRRRRWWCGPCIERMARVTGLHFLRSKRSNRHRSEGNKRKCKKTTASHRHATHIILSSSRDPEGQKSNPHLKECNSCCPNQCSERDSEDSSPLDLHAHLLPPARFWDPNRVMI
jgi:hypothetical protein